MVAQLSLIIALNNHLMVALHGLLLLQAREDLVKQQSPV
jgi:hypothetical protein